MGDMDFEKFINNDDDDRQPLPFFLVFSLREKMKSISEMYRTTADLIATAQGGLKKELNDFVMNLIKSANHTLTQFDILMASEIINSEESTQPEGEIDEEDLPE